MTEQSLWLNKRLFRLFLDRGNGSRCWRGSILADVKNRTGKREREGSRLRVSIRRFYHTECKINPSITLSLSFNLLFRCRSTQRGLWSHLHSFAHPSSSHPSQSRHHTLEYPANINASSGERITFFSSTSLVRGRDHRVVIYLNTFVDVIRKKEKRIVVQTISRWNTFSQFQR